MNRLLPLLISLLTLNTFATSFVNRPFEEVVKEAPIVARGLIGMSYGDYVKGTDGVRRIFTFTELRVTEVMKGSLNQSSVTFREIGGEKDGMGMQVSGTATFSKGEDVVVFLQEVKGEGVFDLLGMMMGKLNVDRDSDGREVLSGSALGGMGEHLHVGEGHEAPKEPTKKWYIEDLRKLTGSSEVVSSAAPSTPNMPAAAKSNQIASNQQKKEQNQENAAPQENITKGKTEWILLGSLILAAFLAYRLWRSRSL